MSFLLLGLGFARWGGGALRWALFALRLAWLWRFARWGRLGVRRLDQQQDSGTRTAWGDWDELSVKGAVP